MLLFALVTEDDRLVREQRLEDERFSKLLTRSRPTVGGFIRNILVRVLSDVDRLVHQTHLLVRSLVFKVIAVLLAEVEDELNDLRSCVGDLDRVRLDVCDSEALLLDCVLEFDHEQGPTLCNDIVDVSRILERVIKAGACQTIDDVDSNLQCFRQRLSVLGIVQVSSKLPTEHLLSRIEILVFDRDTRLLEIREVLGVLTKRLKSLNTCRMHRSNIQKGHIGIHPWLRVDISSFTGDLPSVGALTMVEDITREDSVKMRVLELLLGLTIFSEHDLRSVSLRRMIHGQSTEVRQNLTSNIVALTCLMNSLSRHHIILTI